MSLRASIVDKLRGISEGWLRSRRTATANQVALLLGLFLRVSLIVRSDVLFMGGLLSSTGVQLSADGEEIYVRSRDRAGFVPLSPEFHVDIEFRRW